MLNRIKRANGLWAETDTGLYWAAPVKGHLTALWNVREVLPPTVTENGGAYIRPLGAWVGWMNPRSIKSYGWGNRTEGVAGIHGTLEYVDLSERPTVATPGTPYKLKASWDYKSHGLKETYTGLVRVWGADSVPHVNGGVVFTELGDVRLLSETVGHLLCGDLPVLGAHPSHYGYTEWEWRNVIRTSLPVTEQFYTVGDEQGWMMAVCADSTTSARQEFYTALERLGHRPGRYIRAERIQP